MSEEREVRYAPPATEEWQITTGDNTVHIFRNEDRAKEFVEGLAFTWPGKQGGKLEINVRRILRHDHFGDIAANFKVIYKTIDKNEDSTVANFKVIYKTIDKNEDSTVEVESVTESSTGSGEGP